MRGSVQHMLIRAEREEDFVAIAALLRAAFNGEYEAELVASMRRHENYIPKLTLVAELDGEVVAHVMFSRVLIGDRHGLALGPVAVLPEHQNRGIGTAVIRHGLAIVDRGTAYGASAVLGSPRYYPRFGYSQASVFDVYPPVPWDDAAFMFRPGTAGDGFRGMVSYPAPWKINAGDLNNVRLRRATNADATIIARVFKIAFRHALPHMPLLHSSEEDAQFFLNAVQSNTCESMVAETDECIVGFVIFDNISRFVNHLYVLPIAQHHGVGSSLLKIAMQKHPNLNLWTFQRNRDAIRFYERHGFRVVKHTDGAQNEEREPDVLLGLLRDSKP